MNCLELKSVRWRKGLWGSPKNPLKLTAEVRLATEVQFGRSGLVGISLGNQFFCQATLQATKPMAWRTIEIVPENALQLPL